MNRFVTTNFDGITPEVLPPPRREGRLRLLCVASTILGFRRFHETLIQYCAKDEEIDAVHVELKGSLAMRIIGKQLPGIRRSGWDLHSYRYLLMWRWLLKRQFAARIPTDRFDVIHLMTQNNAMVMLDLREHYPARFVINIDLTAPLEGRELGLSPTAIKPMARAEQRMFAAADLISCRNWWCTQSLRGDYNLPESKFIVTRNSVELSRNSRLDAPAAPMNRKIRLVFVGTDYVRKGGPRLLKIHQERFADRAELHIVSGRAIPISSARNVIWHGHVPNQQLRDQLLPSMDIFVLPTRYEGLPWSVLEAASAALPVIATHVGAVPEAVIHGVTGFVLEREDWRGIGDAIERLMADPELRRRMGEAGRELIRTDFNPDVQFNGLLTRLKALPDQARRPVLAVIANSHTPYRLHLHRRIAKEMTEFELASIYTHGESNSRWIMQDVAEINPAGFGQNEAARDQDRLSRSLHEWRKGGQIIRWLRARPVAAVLIGGYNDLGRIRIIRWCRRHGVPCGLVADSNIKGDRTAGAVALFKRFLVSRVVSSCRWILPCGTLGTAYFKKYGASDAQIFLFPYEPDYDLIRAIAPSQITAVAQQFGLMAGRRRLLYSGRLVSVKRLDLVVDAFVQIAAQRPEWDLVIAGDGPLRYALEARIPLGLLDRVVWTGFIDDQEIVSALYRNADVLVLASDFEPWALVINEAAAAGLAIVSSDVVGASAELVRDGINGHVFKAGDLQALVTSLLQVTDGNRADEMKAASASVLADWRQRADPVDGLRHALEASNLIPAHSLK